MDNKIDNLLTELARITNAMHRVLEQETAKITDEIRTTMNSGSKELQSTDAPDLRILQNALEMISDYDGGTAPWHVWVREMKNISRKALNDAHLHEF